MSEHPVNDISITSDNLRPPSTEDKLEGILYQYIDLFEKIQSEKTVFKDQATRIGKELESMQKTQDDFAKLASVVRGQLDVDLGRAAKRMEAGVGDIITEKTHQAAQALNVELRAAKETLLQYRQEVIEHRWSMFLGMLSGSVLAGSVVGVIVFWFFTTG